MKRSIIINLKRSRIFKSLLAAALPLLFPISACNDLLDVGDPKTLVSKDAVFENDLTAISAVAGIYGEFMGPAHFASGAPSSITALAGLSSDELRDINTSTSTTNVALLEFYNNDISTTNGNVLSLWTSAYKTIYEANAAIEGMTKSKNLSQVVKAQLLGEVHFLRAFTYFYLTNIFGNVPLALTTDYEMNTSLARSTTEQVNNQIEQDLFNAQSLLGTDYPSQERVRVNRAVATAFLARFYLYRKKWPQAEAQATAVINDPRYSLSTDLTTVFQSTSLEAIWQLRPYQQSYNTWEGYYFILTSFPQYYALTNEFVSAFRNEDSRKASWIGTFNAGAQDIYYPAKYKVKVSSSLTEYSMVLRLAEQFLIRAEARAQQGHLFEAVADLDVIKQRANLPSVASTNPGIIQQDLILEIMNERRLELFSEWGHRWFDLKRTATSDQTLASVKTDWQSSDELYPLPASEFDKNPNLYPQNTGY